MRISDWSSDVCSSDLGLDGNTPAGQVSFLDVVMHEFGHGLGFQNFENEAAGTFLANRQDIYSVFTFDNTAGKYWTQMTRSEERRVGQESVSTCRYRWSRYH